jgi:hypothetical protein
MLQGPNPPALPSPGKKEGFGVPCPYNNEPINNLEKVRKGHIPPLKGYTFLCISVDSPFQSANIS